MRLPIVMISTMSPVCKVSAVHSSDLELDFKHWIERIGVLFGELSGVDRREEAAEDEEDENEPLIDEVERSMIISVSIFTCYVGSWP